jgi:hypothetical protein
MPAWEVDARSPGQNGRVRYHFQMRNSFLVGGALLALVLSGCEDTQRNPQSDPPKACANAVVRGAWTGEILGNGDELTFNDDCTGTASYCGASFTYPMVSEASGTAAINVTVTNNNEGCLPLGTVSCGYSVDGDTLTFDCGGAVLTYTRK